MPTSAQEDDDHHNIHIAQQNLPGSGTEDKMKKFQDKMEGFLKQIVDNYFDLITYFQTTTNLLKNIDDHMTVLV